MLQNSDDACVYWKREIVQIVFVTLYVDDLLVASSWKNFFRKRNKSSQIASIWKTVESPKKLPGSRSTEVVLGKIFL